MFRVVAPQNKHPFRFATEKVRIQIYFLNERPLLLGDRIGLPGPLSDSPRAMLTIATSSACVPRAPRSNFRLPLRSLRSTPSVR